jgi:hypothetical protein
MVPTAGAFKLRTAKNIIMTNANKMTSGTKTFGFLKNDNQLSFPICY